MFQNVNIPNIRGDLLNVSSSINAVAHNMLAMNASRQYSIICDAKATASEKLSSGYKINRAADDSAGLAISEKMRRQIRGLSQAAENIQDGVSLCQVADGALNETQDILQRINELAIKSATRTNTDSDRRYIQSEVGQLLTEVDRIATDTCFNEKIHPLLAGDEKSTNLRFNIPLKEASIRFRNQNTHPFSVDGVPYQYGDEYLVYGFSLEGN